MSSLGCQHKSDQIEQSLKPHPWLVLSALCCGWSLAGPWGRLKGTSLERRGRSYFAGKAEVAMPGWVQKGAGFPFIVPQAWRPRRMACQCSSSPDGGRKDRLCLTWWQNTRLWVLSSMSCPSAASSSPWRSSMPPAMAPSSTTRVCSPGTEGPRPSTGKVAKQPPLPELSSSLSPEQVPCRCLTVLPDGIHTRDWFKCHQSARTPRRAGINLAKYSAPPQ